MALFPFISNDHFFPLTITVLSYIALDSEHIFAWPLSALNYSRLLPISNLHITN